jgi:hypothetical protein
MVQWWFLLDVIECGFDAPWLGWWKKWATVHDLELCGLGERRGWWFVNRDHIDRPGRPWNRTVAWGLFIPSSEPDPFTILAFLLLFPLPLSLALMERGDLSRGYRASEEVDGPPEAQHRRTNDWAFTGSDRVLNTGGLSTGGLFRIATMAQTR